MLKTTDSINKQIFKIALPLIFGFIFITLYEVIDIFWIGKLNSKAVAAVGAASFLEWTLFALMNITNTGCATLVSQSYGVRNYKKTHQIIRESFLYSILFTLVFMIVLAIFSEKIFKVMGLDAQTTDYALKYFSVLILGLPVLYLLNLQDRIFSSFGNTKVSTIIMFGTLVVNLILDPILIFGYFGFPKLGITGAAIATVFSEFLGLILKTYYMRKKNYIPPLSKLFPKKLSYFFPIIKIGFPSALTNVIWTLVFPALTIIITMFGMLPLAGLNISNRLEGIPYYFSLGFSMAIATLVGIYYGQNDISKIRLVVKKGLVIITIVLFPVSILFILIPEFLVGLLNSDPKVVSHAAQYLRIVGYFEIFLGYEMILEGVFNGLGRTYIYTLIRVPLTLARIPLAYFFAITLNFGISGVWWAISITTLLKGMLLIFALKLYKIKVDGKFEKIISRWRF